MDTPSQHMHTFLTSYSLSILVQKKPSSVDGQTGSAVLQYVRTYPGHGMVLGHTVQLRRKK